MLLPRRFTLPSYQIPSFSTPVLLTFPTERPYDLSAGTNPVPEDRNLIA
jgi:hypothetical protein